MRRSSARRDDPRAVAHEVLVRVEATDAFADVLLGHRLGETRLTALDRSLATELVYGTLAWQARLDHELRTLVRGRLDGLDPPVRAALRLGLYQLRFLDRIPAYAAVDGSVRRVAPAARGLVNAVLRGASRRGPPPLPDATADPAERLAVEWSHPRWLVDRWTAELGQERTAHLLEALNRPAPLAVRVNRLRTTREDLLVELAAGGIRARSGAYATTAVGIEHGAGRVRALRAFRDGRLAFQSEASQLVAELVDAGPPASVLDACAAPGGKTLAIAERLGEGGRVLALDPRHSALRRIVAEARRLGTSGVAVVRGDARRPPTDAVFDAVLVDAPCSGLGTLRRHPELKWRRTPDDIPRLASLQSAILAAVAPLVRAGGLLVYAVCTTTPEETSAVVARFLGAAPRFVVEPPTALPCVDGDGAVRTAPDLHDLDGFFAVRLRARGDRPG